MKLRRQVTKPSRITSLMNYERLTDESIIELVTVYVENETAVPLDLISALLERGFILDELETSILNRK